MNNARFVLVKLAGVTLLLAVQTPARAADVFFNPGFLFSAGGGERAVGLGGEASLMAYPNDELWGYGGFLQAQSFGGDYARYAAGFQTGSLVGAEAGLVALTASDEHRSSMGAHLGAFVSLAVFGAGLRVTAPVGSGSPDDLERHPIEASFVLTLKVPLLIGGDGFNFSHGRPLRAPEGVRLASVRAGYDWSECPAPLVAHLSLDQRRRLAEAWLADARTEHASIAAFVVLARELLQLGAPAHLADACEAAARDELAHAKLCFALASGYAGQPLGPAALDTSDLGSSPSLCEVARWSFVDGCVGEGFAVRVARRALGCATDPAVRGALEVIERDEARHAELAWTIVDFCLSRAPESTGAALTAALGEPPPRLSKSTSEHDQLWSELRAHGRVPESELRTLLSQARQCARKRLKRRLAGVTDSCVAAARPSHAGIGRGVQPPCRC
jgi:hypothetical protein